MNHCTATTCNNNSPIYWTNDHNELQNADTNVKYTNIDQNLCAVAHRTMGNIHMLLVEIQSSVQLQNYMSSKK